MQIQSASLTGLAVVDGAPCTLTMDVTETGTAYTVSAPPGPPPVPQYGVGQRLIVADPAHPYHGRAVTVEYVLPGPEYLIRPEAVVTPEASLSPA